MRNFYFLLIALISFQLHSQEILKYEFTSDDEGWTFNMSATNLSHNLDDGAIDLALKSTYTSSNIVVNSPGNLSLSTNDIKYIVVKVKSTSINDNQVQLAPNITNDSGTYTTYLNPFQTHIGVNDFETIVFDMSVDYGTDDSGRPKWDNSSTLNKISLRLKPWSSASDGTWSISEVSLLGENFTMNEFSTNGLNFWTEKQWVSSLNVDENGSNLTVTAEKTAFIRLNSGVEVPGTFVYMYVTLVNSTSDNQLRVVKQGLGSVGNNASMTPNSEDEQTIELDISSIALNTSNNFNSLQLLFKNTANSSNTSSGGDYLIKSIVFSETQLSSGDFERIQLSMYPNPVDEFLFIDSEYKLQSEIYNMSGQKMLDSSSNSINVSKLPKGVYLLKRGKNIKKFIKK